MDKTLKWFLIFVAVVFVMWNPITRQVVLFLLPLGSGVDDLVFIIAIVFAIVLRLILVIKEKRNEG